MARPTKNYCDYFPHDRDMRNHRKIKAIRTKFGVEGYAIWSMLLEYLTGIDGNVFEYSESEFELIGGDFGVSVETIRSLIDYCIKLELLFLKDGFVNSESLDERLKPVYIKRGVSKSNSKKQQRSNGKFVNNNTVSYGITVTEMPQIKVNKSKEDKINIDFDVFWNLYDKKVGKQKSEILWVKLKNEEREKAIKVIPIYKSQQPDPKFRKDPERFIKNKTFNDEIFSTEQDVGYQVQINKSEIEKYRENLERLERQKSGINN